MGGGHEINCHFVRNATILLPIFPIVMCLRTPLLNITILSNNSFWCSSQQHSHRKTYSHVCGTQFIKVNSIAPKKSKYSAGGVAKFEDLRIGGVTNLLHSRKSIASVICQSNLVNISGVSKNFPTQVCRLWLTADCISSMALLYGVPQGSVLVPYAS